MSGPVSTGMGDHRDCQLGHSYLLAYLLSYLLVDCIYHVNTDAGQPRTHKSSVMSSSDSRNASFTQVSLLLTACPLPDLDLDLSLITRT